MREGYFCVTDSAAASINAAIFADCSSMDIRIALPYPLDGARNSGGRSLWDARETRQLLLSLPPHPGYGSAVVQLVQLTY